MKKYLLMMLAIVLSLWTMGQSMGNYSFSYSYTGSLQDMTGATVLMTGNNDDAGSSVTDIGFTFVYMGVPYTQFSANSNGQVRLGSTAVGGSGISSYAAGVPVIAPMGGDNEVNNGISYKVFGSSPSRILVVEWNQFYAYYTNITNSGNMQLLLYENGGKVEFIYGEVYNSQTAVTSRPIFLSASNVAGKSGSITVGAIPTFETAATTPVSNSFAASVVIANLGGLTQGSRTVYTFTPSGTAPAAPVTFSYTAVTATGMTANWLDNSTNETGFVLTRAKDAGFTTEVVTTAIASTSTATTGDTYTSGAITGLQPGTTYYFKVVAANEGFVSPVLSGSQSTSPPGTITAIASGLWSVGTTWSGGVAPTATDDAVIPNDMVVTVDAATNTCYSLTIQSGGTVNVASGTANKLTINHNLVNNGSLDMYISSTVYADLTFTGNYTSTFSGAGAITDIATLTINKGSGTVTTASPVLEVLTTNLTVRDASSATAVGSGFLNTGTFNGILKLSGSYTITNPVFLIAAYSVPSSGGIWLNNANFTVAGMNGSPTMSGLLLLTSGVFNIGTSSGNSMGLSSSSKTYIEGGSLNATGRFGVGTSSNTITFSQTGGDITVCTVGNTSTSLASFDLGTSSTSTIALTGGTIKVKLNSTAASGPRDFRGASTSVIRNNYEGTTLYLGDASSPAAQTFYLAGSVPPMVIATSPYVHKIALSASAYYYGNLTLAATSDLNLNGFGLWLKGNFVNNGTVTGNATGSRIDFANTLFLGSSAQTYSGAGTFGASATPVLSVGINNTAGVTLSSPIYALRVNLFTGALTGSANVTLGNGTSGAAITQVGGVATLAGGSYDASPLYNLGATGTYGVIYSVENAARTTGNEIPASRSINSLSTSNTLGVTLSGGALASGTLALSSSILTTSAANLLTITGTTAGSVSGYTATGYVNGPIARTFPASLATGTTYVFPVGKSAYKPLEMINALTTAGGPVVVTAEVFDANSGGTAGANMSALNTDRYWNATITSGAANFTSSTVRLTETGLTGNNGIGKSATQAGAYDLVSSAAPVGSTLTSDVITSLDYFVIGTKSVPMAYTSSTVTQASTATVLHNSADQVVIGIQVVTTGNASPLSATKFTVSGNGTTAAGDISNAKIWYTGTSATFAATTQFGSTFATPTLTAFDITGTQVLEAGTNYFWLTFDVPLTATGTHVIDAECTVVGVGASDYTPTATAPTGSRTITINAPTALTANGVSGTQINLGWTLNSVGQDVILATNSSSTFGIPANGTAYTAGTPLPTAGTVIYVGPLSAFNHTGLTSGTTYYYKMWSVDANNYYSSGSVTATGATAFAVPYTQNFNAATTIPAGWATDFSVSATHGASASNGLYKNLYSSYPTGYASSPNVVLSANDCQLKFDYRIVDWSGYPATATVLGATDKIEVQVSTDGGTNYTVVYTINSTTHVTSTSFATKTIELTGYNSQTVKVRFNCVWGSGDYYIDFDNFILEEIPSCPTPSALTATAVTATTATLGWTAGGTETAWEYVYGTSPLAVPSGSGTASASNSVNISGLSSGTTYQFYVRANCGSLFSEWAGPYSFTTNYAVPYIQDFNAATTLPTGWSGTFFVSSTHGASSTNGLYRNLYSSVPTANAVAPNVALSANNCQLKFDYRIVNYSSYPSTATVLGATDKIDVEVSTDGGTNYLVLYTINNTNHVSSTSFATKTIALTGYNSQTVKVRLNCVWGEGDYYVDFDNFILEEIPLCPYPTSLASVPSNYSAAISWIPGDLNSSWDVEWSTSPYTFTGTPTIAGLLSPGTTLSPLTPVTGYTYQVRANCAGSYSIWVGPHNFTTLVACPAPTALNASGILTTSAKLGWTENGTATSWDIELIPTGGTFTGTPTVTGTGDNPYTASGLTSGTSYSFKVRSSCSVSEQSTWAGPYTFVTLCEVATSYSQNFDAVTAPAMPACWAKISTTGSASTQASSASSSPNCLYIYGYSSIESVVSMPEISNAGAGTHRLRFKLRGNFTAGDAIEVGYLTIAGDPASFVALESVTASSLTYEEHITTPGTVPGTAPMFAFRHPGALGYSILIDDVYWEVIPTCVAPSALNVPSVTATTANLAWTASSSLPSGGYEWEVRTSGVGGSGSTGLVTSGTTAAGVTTATANGLTASSAYSFYVRAVCGAGDYSIWAGPTNFATLCNSYTLPYSQNFDAVTAPAIPLCMTVANDNADAQDWRTSASYSRSAPNSMYISYNASAAMDDWFFSPALTLAPGTYSVSFWYRGNGSYVEKLEVKWGSAASASGMTSAAIFTNENILNTAFVEGTATFTVTTAGDYFIGWHGYSDADMWYMAVDDISVNQVLAHDVATLSVNLPSLVDVGTVTPTATVKNQGTNTESFPVTLTIDTYTSTQTVTALAPGASLVVSFDPWTAVAGSYSAEVCTELTAPADENAANNCVTKAITVEDVTAFYSYNTFTSEVGYFYKEYPGTFVPLAAATSADFISAGTWAEGVWYGAEYYDATAIPPTGGGWYTINPNSGAMSLISSGTINYSGITFDHITGKMYGCSWDGATNTLYEINRFTGVGTALGTFGEAELMINLAADGSGLLYSLGITTDHLFSINPATLATVDIGATGIAMSYAQDMEYDYASNTMYAAAYTTVGALHTVNLTTGACTLVGAFAGNAEMTGLAIPYTTTKTLNVSLFLEGLYAGAGTMNQAIGLSGPEFGAGIADKVTIELWDESNLTAAAYTFSDLDLMTDGSIAIPDVPGAVTGNYYIVVKHRNSIETWSAAAVSFAGAGPIDYNFSTDASQAYDNNMKVIGGVALIYGGNANADDIVDGSDMALIDNASTAVLAGYNPEDCNGDGIVDGSDMAMVDNNSTATIQLHRP